VGTYEVYPKTLAGERQRLSMAFRRYIMGVHPGKEIGMLVGAPHYDVKQWITSRFREGMNWNNYEEIWIIIHLCPVRLFNVKDEADLKVLWHYKNLYPIYKTDRIRAQADLRWSLTVLDGLNEGLNPMIMKLSNKLVDEITIMNKYL
jgi:hypothetical protein